MKNKLEDIDLDALSYDELNELLDRVMVKLRQRDAIDLKENFITKSQRITLPEKIARHIANQ